MTKQEALKKFNEEFQQRLKDAIFPAALLPKNFTVWFHAALQYESPATVSALGLTWDEFKKLALKLSGFTLFEMAMISNIIQTKSANQLQPYLFDDNYYFVQDGIKVIDTKWNEIVNPIRDAVDKKIEIMSAAGGQMHDKPLKMVRN